MTKEEIEKEWQKELRELLSFHNEKTKNMSEAEEWEYLKKNAVDTQIKKLQEKYQRKYKDVK